MSKKYKLTKGSFGECTGKLKGNANIKEGLIKDDAAENGTCAATGSLRYNSGKPDCHHIHPKFLMALAALMTDSAKKYETYNYMKGQPFSVPYNSMMRHIHSFMDGEDKDPESGHSHLTHIAANAMILWVSQNYQLDNYPELDDRYKKVLGLE